MEVDMEIDEMDMVWENIPECLIVEVFAKLPVKSLCRFRCVSKFYLSLTHDPSFLGRIQIPPIPPFEWQIQYKDDISVYSIDCDGVSSFEDYSEFADDFEELGLLNGSYCEGLNCFRYNDTVGLCVFNLATKECIQLPSRCKNGIICFDSLSERYKVLGWVDMGYQMPVDYFILTLGRDASWRPVMNPMGISECIREPSAIINGEPFWDSYERKGIVSFQPANEVFRVIDFPDQLSKEPSFYSVFGLEGFLCLVEQYRLEEPTFSLWILKGEVWFLLRKITLPFEGTGLHDYYSRANVRGWTADGSNFSFCGGKLLVPVIGEDDYQFIFIYNFLNNQFKTIKITGLQLGYPMTFNVGSDLIVRNYVENCISLQDLLSFSPPWHVNLSQKFKKMDEMVAVSFPDSLIIEIFSRLPVKSLCRFKCVSKFCLAFIQDPVFVDQIRPKTPILWQIEKDKDVTVFSVDCNGFSTLKHAGRFQDGFPYFQLSNGRYCNGVNLNCFVYNDNFGLCVRNITTKECITLPRWGSDCIFCFDSLAKKYKVLGWVEKNDEMAVNFCVFTLERDPSWKPVMNPLKVGVLVEPDVIVDGEPFWLYEDKRQIISFNPTKEEFRVIVLPAELSEETFWCCIFEFEGSLSLVEQHRSEEPIFTLWKLNDNGWVMMKKNIAMSFKGTSLLEYYSTPGIENWRAYGYNFSSHGGELLVAVVGDFDNQFLFRYNFLNNQFKWIKFTGLPFCDLGGGLRMRKFVENYVCIQELLCGGTF